MRPGGQLGGPRPQTGATGAVLVPPGTLLVFCREMAEVSGIRSGGPPDGTPKVSRQLPARPDLKFQTGTKLARFLPHFFIGGHGRGVIVAVDLAEPAGDKSGLETRNARESVVWWSDRPHSLSEAVP